MSRSFKGANQTILPPSSLRVGGQRESLSEKYCGCIKSVRRSVKVRKSNRTGKPSQNRESAAIAICTKAVLQSRCRTLRKFNCKRGRSPSLKTQNLLK